MRINLALAMALLLPVKVAGQTVHKADADSVTIPFEYAANRPSLLIHVSINGKHSLLVLDTGSAHTVVRPELVGLKRSDLKPATNARPGAAFIGDAIGAKLTLQVGNRTWQKYRVVAMDLSQVLSAYQEHLDGVLGLEFFQEFRRVTIDLPEHRIELTH